MHFIDKMTFDGGIRRTQDGYAVIEARVARAGNVQIYRGDEMGAPERATVRVYRPEAEVFKRDAIASYAGVPVTMGHPAGKVTADSWKSLAVGEAGEDVLRDGDFVRVPLMLRDKAAIDAVDAGMRELSMGYDAMLTFEDGVSPSGEEYDAVMSGFRMNHVAIVDRARGGKELRIGDGVDNWGASPVAIVDKETSVMTDKTTQIVRDGLPVSVPDTQAPVIQKWLSDADKALADKQTALDAANETIKSKDTELAKKDADIDDLKAKIVDGAALDKLVADRAALVNTAKAIAKDVKTDGLSDADIRKAVVSAKLGDEAIKDKAQAYIDARFDILAEDASEDEQKDDYRETVRGGVKHTVDAKAKAVEARSGYINHLRDAWKGEAPIKQ